MSQWPILPPVRQAIAQIQESKETILSRLNHALLDNTLSVNLRGRSVAIGVGSRGIRAIAAIVHAIASGFSELGATPFIFPAMGSHGGGTGDVGSVSKTPLIQRLLTFEP